MGKNIGKNVSKNLSSKYSEKLLDHAKKSATNLLKPSLEKQFKKQQKQLVIWLVPKFLIKLQQSQEVHPRINQRQSKVKQKYQKQYIYPQKKSKLLIIRLIRLI